MQKNTTGRFSPETVYRFSSRGGAPFNFVFPHLFFLIEQPFFSIIPNSFSFVRYDIIIFHNQRLVFAPISNIVNPIVFFFFYLFLANIIQYCHSAKYRGAGNVILLCGFGPISYFF